MPILLRNFEWDGFDPRLDMPLPRELRLGRPVILNPFTLAAEGILACTKLQDSTSYS